MVGSEGVGRRPPISSLPLTGDAIAAEPGPAVVYGANNEVVRLIGVAEIVRGAHPGAPADSIPALRLPSWALAFGLWTLISLASAFSAGLAEISQGNPPTWTRMVVWNLVNFWLWMLLVPCIGWLGRVTSTNSWGRFCLIHGSSSFAMAAVQAPVRIAIFWELLGPRNPTVHTLGQYMRGELVDNLHLAILTYWAVLVMLRALESRRSLNAQRLCTARLEAQLAQSQVRALRMQLQPHFLFNTLNSISALVLAEPPRAKQMIARLSDLLRLTLEDDRSHLLPLERELQLVRNYLDIQQMRFGDRMTPFFDVSHETLAAEVPSMILQPLIENALRHGLLNKSTHGTLHVRARRAHHRLHLVVEDDGLGLSPSGIVEGLGLTNTRARLDTLFGAAASLRVRSREGGGTLAELCFPFREAAAESRSRELP